MSNPPVRGATYSARQIFSQLELLDSPSLLFMAVGPDGKLSRHVIQNGHMLNEEILAVPGFAETLWVYEYTTNEWIPIFSAVGNILPYVDVEPYLTYTDEPPTKWWATLKGHPRKQYIPENY